MQAGSVKSLERVLEATEAALSSGADASALGDALFTVALMLDERHELRRALTEPAVPAAAKSALVERLLKGKIPDPAFEVVDSAVRVRWSKRRDLADALEHASVSAHVAAADKAGHLDDLEDSLFRFSRIIEGEQQLGEFLADRDVPLEGKRKLLHALLGAKVDAPTERLLGQAIAGRRRTLAAAFSLYQKIAAERRERLVAMVWVADPLDDERRRQLEAALERQYSREVHLNVIVDPQVLGGVRVAIGDEIIDSTIQTRLVQARRRLVR